jgi:hypothetical protein
MIRTCLLGVIYENEHILYVGVKWLQIQK